MSTILKRLTEFLAAENSSMSALNKALGLGNSGLENGLKGSKGVGIHVISKILDIYPNLDFDWLITGRGEMLIDLSPKEKNQSLEKKYPLREVSGLPQMPLVITVNPRNEETITLVPVPARAGYMVGYADPEYIETLQTLPMLPGLLTGTYRAFQVEGFSMFKEDIGEGLRDGEWIICKYVESFKDIKNEMVYTIVSTKGISVKRVLNRLVDKSGQPIEDDPKLICMSDNKSGNPDFNTFTLEPAEIKEVWSFSRHIGTHLTNPRDLFDKISEIQGNYVIMEETIRMMKMQIQDLQTQSRQSTTEVASDPEKWTRAEKIKFLENVRDKLGV